MPVIDACWVEFAGKRLFLISFMVLSILSRRPAMFRYDASELNDKLSRGLSDF